MLVVSTKTMGVILPGCQTKIVENTSESGGSVRPEGLRVGGRGKNAHPSQTSRGHGEVQWESVPGRTPNHRLQV